MQLPRNNLLTTMITTFPMFTIDTLAFSRKLEKAGIKKETAEALAEAIQVAQAKSYEILTTKQDIKIAMLTTIISLGTITALIAKFAH